MLGQSFFPGGPDDVMRRQEGGGPVNPVQEAIRVLSLKMPRVPGAGAVAAPQLLSGLGSAGMPSVAPPGLGGGEGGPVNPLATLIQQMFAPGAPTQQGPSSGPPPVQGKPVLNFIPPPGGVAAGPQAPEQGGRTPTETGEYTGGWAVNRPGSEEEAGTPPINPGGRGRTRSR